MNHFEHKMYTSLRSQGIEQEIAAKSSSLLLAVLANVAMIREDGKPCVFIGISDVDIEKIIKALQSLK